MTKILFIDFDETLFHHPAYLSWADKFMVQRQITSNLGEFEALTDQFHESKGENMVLYDHLGHIKSVTTRSWGYVSGEIEKEISEQGHDFCYDDAHDFIKKAVKTSWDVRILTYGHGDYQRYKIRTCRHLSDLRIPIHLVSEPKSDFIEREFGDKEGILIDDKYPLHLPKGWKHIWIDRQGAAKQLQGGLKKAQKVNNLNQIALDNHNHF